MTFDFGLVLLALAGLPAILALTNLKTLKGTPACAPEADSFVSILIPARNEAANIGAALDAALTSVGVRFEVLVMDDGSNDGTDLVVGDYAARDLRVRLLAAPALEAGWTGKIHACHHLSKAALGTHLLFVDADVRLGPHAAAALTGHSQRNQMSLVSAVPRQTMRTWGELLTVPSINMLLLGYLPVRLMRRSLDPAFGAACGQLMLVEREAYRKAGGHEAIRGLLHDGIQLARLFRRQGYITDLVPGDGLATCRMYNAFTAAWAGFAKNAREGMATPVGLPIWTALLLGGHVLPFIVLAFAPTWPVGLAAFLSLITRSLITFSTRENPLSIPLHPVTTVVALAIQWSVLLGIRTGEAAGWKGRLYPVN